MGGTIQKTINSLFYTKDKETISTSLVSTYSTITLNIF